MQHKIMPKQTNLEGLLKIAKWTGLSILAAVPVAFGTYSAIYLHSQNHDLPSSISSGILNMTALAIVEAAIITAIYYYRKQKL